MKPFQVAIDGPVAAGKGTVARMVADRIGGLYVDTGAMYRVAAFLAEKAEVSWEDEEGVEGLVKKAKIEMRSPQGDKEKDGRLITIFVDGEDVSGKIRTEKMSEGASVVSVHKKVRDALVDKQQKIALRQTVVMEGRDITFRVLPKADLKIYLTAKEEERAKRRYEQLKSRGGEEEYEKVFSELKKRDSRDSSRKVDPLHVVSEAWVLDTTEMSINQVVDNIVARVEALQSKK